MTEPSPTLGSERAARSGAAASRVRFDPRRGIEGCPYLASHDAVWSSAYTSRDLRCWATDPASLPAAQKQRQLCLTPGHQTCSSYRAASLADPGLRPSADDDIGLWPSGPIVPVAFDSVHARPGVSVSSPRAGGQALLVGLMVVAFLVLVIARTSPLASGGASPSPAATIAASAVAATLAPSPSPLPSLEASPTPAAPSATAPASASPTPSATQRTYKVRSGDTIASIAAKYHTTVKAIVAANNIVDPRTIHPGQVLIIP